MRKILVNKIRCKKCGDGFLSLQTMERIPCPACEGELDLEIGPDESMEEMMDTAELVSVLEGEDVEKMDILLSLAITGGNYEWLEDIVFIGICTCLENIYNLGVDFLRKCDTIIHVLALN